MIKMDGLVDANNGASGNVIELVWIALVLAIYFVPTMVALKRGHPQRVAISLLNLLLGWTFVGWVAALVWSATAFTKPDKPELERGGVLPFNLDG